VSVNESRFRLIVDISEYTKENLGFLTTVPFQENLLFAAKDTYVEHVFVRWQENVEKKIRK